jgi:tRNA-dihydrouridine synthase
MDYDKLDALLDVSLTKEIKNQLNEEELTYIRKKKRLLGIAKCNKAKYNNNINGYKFRRLLKWFNNKFGENEEYMKIINNTETTPEQKYYEAKVFSASMSATEFMAKNER